MIKIIIAVIYIFFNNILYASEYTSFVNKVSILGDRDIDVDSFIIEEEKNIIRFKSGTGLYLNKCADSYLCFEYQDLVINIPKSCDSVTKGEWSYQRYKYQIVEILDNIEIGNDDSIKPARVLIKVLKGNRHIGQIIYSSELGVEAFTFFKRKSKPKNLTYFKTSNKGMLSGGCALSLNPDQYPGKNNVTY